MKPLDKYDVVYILCCLLLDGSAIAFNMGLYRVSSFCKMLARRTQERWHLDLRGMALDIEEDSPI